MWGLERDPEEKSMLSVSQCSQTGPRVIMMALFIDPTFIRSALAQKEMAAEPMMLVLDASSISRKNGK